MKPDKSVVEAISTLRAVRHFTDQPVPDTIIKRILELATRAANDRNLQDWRWVVIKDQPTRARIGEIYLGSLMDYYGEQDPQVVLARPDLPRMNRESLNMAFNMARVPPIIILACYHQVTGLDPGMSLYPAIQNLMLAAWSFGLGTVMTTVARRREAAFRELLGLPSDVVIVALIPMGYPSRAYGPPRRKPVEQVAYVDRWGQPPRWQ